MDNSPRLVDAEAGLAALFEALQAAGYALIGPTEHEGAIVYDELASPADLPKGKTDEQAGGHYRLKERGDGAFFGYAVGPHSFKRFLHAPHQELWRAEEKDGELIITPVETAPPRYAFIGMRACEIHAIRIQDRVLRDDAYADSHYAARRADNLFIAVNCLTAGDTCFCVSMGAGPKVEQDFDLALTELIDGQKHSFLVEAGSERGRALLSELPARKASASAIEAAERIVRDTAEQMGREMDAANVHDLLLRNLEHPRWDEVAERCLSCGNCTQVCPTCFCTTTVDSSDLTGTEAGRARQWDSCFTLDFSYLHGGSVRRSTKSRYRQWMTHKLATWIDQFDSSGCVGCGRCITWCPVGIDITEEVRAIEDSEGEP